MVGMSHRSIYIKLIIVVIIFTGCSSTENLTTNGGYNFYGIDFREYAEKDFLITPESPTGNYVSLGLIEVEFIPEIKEITPTLYDLNKSTGILVQGEKVFNIQAINGSSGTTEYYAIERPDVQKAIDQIYEKSIEWDANSLYKFNIESKNMQGVLTYTILKISGFAIKR